MPPLRAAPQPSSPLTSPPDSSFSTYHSAQESHSPKSQTLSPPTKTSLPQPHRRAAFLPYELCEHCLIYFEESLYSQALNLLTSVLTSTPPPPSTHVDGFIRDHRPTFVAPPHFVAFMATLAVHPSFTNRARDPDKRQVSNLALRYLRLLLASVDPVDAHMGDAFSYESDVRSRTGQARGKSVYAKMLKRTPGTGPKRKGDGAANEVNGSHGAMVDGASDEPIMMYEDSIGNDLANVNSLWARAEDFWHVVGWSLNCSIKHRKRWEQVWSKWMDFHLQVLEQDWRQRRLKDEQGDGNENQDGESSIILRYLCGDEQGAVLGGGHFGNNERRICRAVFADGGNKCMTEFSELWRNETKELKVKDPIDEQRRMTRKIDIGADDYGDYDNEEDEEDDDEQSTSFNDMPGQSPLKMEKQPKTPRPRRRGMSEDLPNDVEAASDWEGHYDSLNIRFRLLSVIFDVAIHFPQHFIPIHRTLDLVHSHIRHTPLPLFFELMSYRQLQYFEVQTTLALTQSILTALISSSAPHAPNEDLNQQVLEVCYLGWPANGAGAEDNAKISICLETLLNVLDEQGLVHWTQELQMTAENGIAARLEKCSVVRKGKAYAEGLAFLQASSQRLRILMGLIKDR